MDSFELMLAIVFMAILFAVTPVGRDFLRGLNKKERITKSSSNALTNVRITNDYNGVTYRPLSILPIDGNEFQLEMETVERPDRIEIKPSLLTSQFKHDVMETLENGFVNYRLVNKEFVNKNSNMNDVSTLDKEKVYDESSDSKYTDKELKILSEVDMDERTILEGELLNLKASRNEEVNKIIENTVKLSSSKYGGV